MLNLLTSEDVLNKARLLPRSYKRVIFFVPLKLSSHIVLAKNSIEIHQIWDLIFSEKDSDSNLLIFMHF